MLNIRAAVGSLTPGGNPVRRERDPAERRRSPRQNPDPHPGKRLGTRPATTPVESRIASYFTSERQLISTVIGVWDASWTGTLTRNFNPSGDTTYRSGAS